MPLITPCPFWWSHTTAETCCIIDYSLPFHKNLTPVTGADPEKSLYCTCVSYAHSLWLLPFKSHSHTLNVQLSFWETAQIEKPLFILRPKKPKMPDVWVDVSGKGTRNDAAKPCLSLPFCLPSYSQWWYFGKWQSEHYGDSFFSEHGDFFPVIWFPPCVSQLTLLQRMEHRRWFCDISKLAATKRMSSFHFSFIPKCSNCLIQL